MSPTYGIFLRFLENRGHRTVLRQLLVAVTYHTATVPFPLTFFEGIIPQRPYGRRTVTVRFKVNRTATVRSQRPYGIKTIITKLCDERKATVGDRTVTVQRPYDLRGQKCHWKIVRCPYSFYGDRTATALHCMATVRCSLLLKLRKIP